MVDRSSLDDAQILKQELATVQRLMDEMAHVREQERDELQKKLNQLQAEHDDLKKSAKPGHDDGKSQDDKLHVMAEENQRLVEELDRLKRTLADKSEQVKSI